MSENDKARQVIAGAADAGVRIAVVETVTGGLLAASLTDVPGASKVFERGYVLYHSVAKTTGLGVDPAVAEAHGAVSAAVTERLAAGLDEYSSADIGVAITGYAGPTGGNDRDPVGTVYIAPFVRGTPDASATRAVFVGDRRSVKNSAVDAALDLLVDLVGSRR